MVVNEWESIEAEYAGVNHSSTELVVSEAIRLFYEKRFNDLVLIPIECIKNFRSHFDEVFFLSSTGGAASKNKTPLLFHVLNVFGHLIGKFLY